MLTAFVMSVVSGKTIWSFIVFGFKDPGSTILAVSV